MPLHFKGLKEQALDYYDNVATLFNFMKCIRCQQNVHSKHTLHILTSNVTAFTAHQQH